jgi:rhamnogalacturonyl hydrolase YesR
LSIQSALLYLRAKMMVAELIRKRTVGGRLTRREALALVSAGLCASARPGVSAQSAGRRLHEALPPGVAAILTRLLAQNPSSINTDWFGTMALLGALQWRRRGVVEVEPFCKAWLAHHLQTTEVAKYSGNRSRTVVAGGIPLTTYAGHFGMSQVCEQMVMQFQDERARKVAADVAAIVLHKTARNRIGLVGHDDTADFALPDVTFFAVSSLMIGAAVDPQNDAAHREQALYQLRTSIETFLIEDTGLAKTLYRGDRVGQTYWTRASGWLLWAITAMLRRLSPQHPAFGGFKADLRRLVDGMTRVQEPNGGFHVLLDDPSTPLDATGPAMFALGVHESARLGWLPDSYRPASEKAWAFVKANLTDAGVLRNTYYLWALPAENRDMRLRDESSGWAMGLVLSAANEMTL